MPAGYAGLVLAELHPEPALEADAAGSAPPFFVVINRSAGGQDPTRTQELLAAVFAQARRPAQFMRASKPATLAGACAAAAGEAARQRGVLVAAGGDGTINSAAAAAIDHGCPLGVVPQGTFNYLAREYGIPLDTEASARALLTARPMPVQVGTVNDRVFLVNASLGLYPQLLRDREAFKARLGRRRWVAVLAGLATVLQWRRKLTLAVDLEGTRTVVTTSTLFVGNNRLQVERVGLDERVTEATGRGRLAGVAIRPLPPWTMLGLVLRGALGRLGDADQVESFSFQALDLTVLGARRVRVATDGEVQRMALPLRFSVGARPLLLMLPQPEHQVPRE